MRPIDADKFEEFIRKNCSDSLVDLWCELVRRQPTIDALPVVHGKWERTDITTEDGWALYRCTSCNWHTTYYYSFSASPTYNFCPNCGAKMDGGT